MSDTLTEGQEADRIDKVVGGLEEALAADQQAEADPVTAIAEGSSDPDAPSQFTERDAQDIASMEAAPEPGDSERPSIADPEAAVTQAGMLENRAIDTTNARAELDRIAAENPADLPAAQRRAVDSLHAASEQDQATRHEARQADVQQMADEHEARHTQNEPLWDRFKNLFRRGESKTGGEN